MAQKKNALDTDKIKTVALGLLMLAVLGGAGYYYRDKLAPKPIGSQTLPPVGDRFTVVGKLNYEKLFGDQRFRDLQRYGEVPVVPKDLGNKDVFRMEIATGQ